MDVWKGSGFYMMIFIAGLQGISPEYYEAAAIDGASKLQQFWYITMPLLVASLTVNITIAMIGGFRVFDQIYVLTKGGPGNANQCHQHHCISGAGRRYVRPRNGHGFDIDCVYSDFVCSDNQYAGKEGGGAVMCAAAKTDRGKRFFLNLLVALIGLLIVIPISIVVLGSFKTSAETLVPNLNSSRAVDVVELRLCL